MASPKKKSREFVIVIPELYVLAHYGNKKLPANVISIESLLILVKKMDLEIEIKEVLRNFWFISLTLLYGVQIRRNAKIEVDKMIKNTSTEKTFQQTNSHHVVTKLLSNSTPAKVILSLMGIQYALNVEAFGVTEEERTLEGTKDAIAGTYDELTSLKGSGTSKVSIKNPETRTEAIRAKIASFRSKWCSIPTYGFDKLLTAGANPKTLKPSDFAEYMIRTSNQWIEDEVVSQEDIPSLSEIKEIIDEAKTELNIPNEIDDAPYAIVKDVPIEKDIFNMDRNASSIVSSREPLPDFLKDLKSGNTKPKRKTK